MGRPYVGTRLVVQFPDLADIKVCVAGLIMTVGLEEADALIGFEFERADAGHTAHVGLGDDDRFHGLMCSTFMWRSFSRRAATRERWQASGTPSTQKRQTTRASGPSFS